MVNNSQVTPVDRGFPLEGGHMSRIVVVGAGSAGSTAAWRLSDEPGTEVVLIEAGDDPGAEVPRSLRNDLLLPDVYDWGYRDADTGEPLRRGKVLGGPLPRTTGGRLVGRRSGTTTGVSRTGPGNGASQPSEPSSTTGSSTTARTTATPDRHQSCGGRS